MRSVISYLTVAMDVASCGDPKRKAFVGAVALTRNSGLFFAYNGSAKNKSPSSHAEIRLLRKIPKGKGKGTDTVYIGRKLRNGSAANARPCDRCRKALKNASVKKVFFTLEGDSYGVIDLETEEEWVVVRRERLLRFSLPYRDLHGIVFFIEDNPGDHDSRGYPVIRNPDRGFPGDRIFPPPL